MEATSYELLDESRSRVAWYALRVRSRHEKSVRDLLLQKGADVLLPLYKDRRRWADRIKTIELPLFEGYVFCRLNPHRRLRIVETPGIIDIVGSGKELYPVDDDEIQAVRRLMESGLQCEPWERLMAGDRVQIDAGPLSGLQGQVVKVEKGLKLVLNVTLLQRSVLVAIVPEWVTPLNAGPRAILGGTAK